MPTPMHAPASSARRAPGTPGTHPDTRAPGRIPPMDGTAQAGILRGYDDDQPHPRTDTACPARASRSHAQRVGVAVGLGEGPQPAPPHSCHDDEVAVLGGDELIDMEAFRSVEELGMVRPQYGVGLVCLDGGESAVPGDALA